MLVTEFVSARVPRDQSDKQGALTPDVTVEPNKPHALPGWAAKMLGYVFSTRSLRPAEGELVELGSLLTLLRVLRRSNPQPYPDRHFMAWAGDQVVAHHRLERQERRHVAMLAEVVAELVPRLHEAERTSLAQAILDAGSEARARPSRATLQEGERPEVASPRLLAGHLGPPPKPQDVRIALVGDGALQAKTPISFSKSAASSPRHCLWSSLNTRATIPHAIDGSVATEMPHAVEAKAEMFEPRSAEVAEAAEADAAKSSEASTEMFATLSSSASTFTLADTEAVSADGVHATPSPPPPSVRAARAREQASARADEVNELRTQLTLTLARMETLEARLGSQERRQRQAATRDASDIKAFEGSGGGDGSQRAFQLSEWVSGAFSGGGPTGLSSLSVPQMVKQSGYFPDGLPFHGAFSFDEYRRAESEKLQAQRYRTLSPPDHLAFPGPVWPPKK